MDEGSVFYHIADITLTIPAWQVALYVLIISLFMLAGRHKLTLLTTYLFTLYWGFFLYWGDVMASLGSFPTLATLYLLCALLHVTLTLIAFFKED